MIDDERNTVDIFKSDRFEDNEKCEMIFCAGLPSLNKIIWVVAQLIYQKYQADETSIESCPLVQDRETDVILVALFSKEFLSSILDIQKIFSGDSNTHPSHPQLYLSHLGRYRKLSNQISF